MLTEIEQVDDQEPADRTSRTPPELARTIDLNMAVLNCIELRFGLLDLLTDREVLTYDQVEIILSKEKHKQVRQLFDEIYKETVTNQRWRHLIESLDQTNKNTCQTS